MFYVYIIQSKEGRYYIGSTSDVEKRLSQHNSGEYCGWTKRYSGWRLIYSETYETRREALLRERQIKRMKGGNGFKKLVGS